jgi:2-enoate reductase
MIKRIAVVGGGPAGVVFAVSAAKRGHQVELFEKSGEIGGKLIPGSLPKIKFDVENYKTYLRRIADEAVNSGNLKINFRSEVTAQSLKEKKYDSIVVAVGTGAVTPKLAGIEKARVVQATDLLTDASLLKDAKNIVIVGGGVVGCETAYWLKYEHDREVKVVEMLPEFMDGVCTANRGHLIYYLKKAGVELINCARVTGFEEKGVRISRNVSPTVPNPYNTWQPILPRNIENPLAKKIKPAFKDQTLQADLVVLAMGGRADDALFFEAQRSIAAPELYNIGDSFSAGKVLEATRSAKALADTI